MQTQQDGQWTFVELLRFVRRGLVWAMLAAVAAGAVAYYSSQWLEPSYEAQTTILQAQTSRELRDLGVPLLTPPSLDANAYRAAVLSDPVIREALERLGRSQISQLMINGFRKNIDVRTEGADYSNSSLIYIEASDGSPEGAADKANALATALVNWDRNLAQDSLDEAVTALEEQINSYEERIRALQIVGGVTNQARIEDLTARLIDQQEQLYIVQAMRNSVTGLLQVLQPASPPLEPASPRPLFNAALAVVLALFVVYGLLLLRESLNMRLRSVDDLAAVSGLPVLAEFPKLSGGTRRLPYEASGYLRTNLLFATPEAHPKVLLVTSAQMGEGKSSVALSLAESFARDNYRTLLVDADLRRPVIAKEYNLDERRHMSLTSLLESPYEPFEAAYVAINLTQHLDVVPSFEPASAPTELLGSGFRNRLDKWREDYDVIVIDSAPMLPVADTLTIAPLCTGTVLVASQQTTDRRQVRLAVDILQRLGVRLLGVVATHVKSSSQGARYGYGYGVREQENSAKLTPITRTAKANPNQAGRSSR